MRLLAGTVTLVLISCSLSDVKCLRADNWPMWRYDSGRTAAAPHDLSDNLSLSWIRRLPPQEPAWRDEAAMQFDSGYAPIAQNGLLFVGSTVNDSLMAFDLETGSEEWRFYTEGPIRVAAAAWRDRVCVASDDGYLYCLRAADGSPLWKFRGGPTGRRLIGNERLISTWPVRGGPVIAEGKVYFAAGVWPFMGVFVHALDAETGRVLWTNDSLSFAFRRLPHPGQEAHSASMSLLVPGSELEEMPGLLQCLGVTTAACMSCNDPLQ